MPEVRHRRIRYSIAFPSSPPDVILSDSEESGSTCARTPFPSFRSFEHSNSGFVSTVRCPAEDFDIRISSFRACIPPKSYTPQHDPHITKDNDPQESRPSSTRPHLPCRSLRARRMGFSPCCLSNPITPVNFKSETRALGTCAMGIRRSMPPLRLPRTTTISNLESAISNSFPHPPTKARFHRSAPLKSRHF